MSDLMGNSEKSAPLKPKTILMSVLVLPTIQDILQELEKPARVMTCFLLHHILWKVSPTLKTLGGRYGGVRKV